jgi:transcriptional regulator
MYVVYNIQTHKRLIIGSHSIVISSTDCKARMNVKTIRKRIQKPIEQAQSTVLVLNPAVSHIQDIGDAGDAPGDAIYS